MIRIVSASHSARRSEFRLIYEIHDDVVMVRVIVVEYGRGAGWPENHNTPHWLENRGRLRLCRSWSMWS